MGSLGAVVIDPGADKQEPTCTTTSSTARCGNFSNAQSPGDVDGDGVADQMVAAYALRRPTIVAPQFFGRVYLFSGKTGAVLSRIDQPVADNNAFWGLDDVAPNTPGDVSGDGVPDLYVMGFNQDGAAGENAAGRGWVFDGKASVASGAGVVLWEPKDPTPQASKAFGWSASRTDYDKDGRPDLYLGGLSAINTATYLYNGRDGSLIKTLGLSGSEAQPNVPGNNGSGLGWSSRAPGDLNSDGEPDFVAAAPFQDVLGNQDQGKLYFFLSKVPASAPAPTPPPPPTPLPTPPPSIPGIVLDRTAPTVKLSGVPSSMSLRAFLKGVRAKVSRNERSSIDATLEGSAKKATLAAAYNLSLASRAVKLGTGTSKITLKPSKKLVGRAKKLRARVRVVVTDASGNRRTVTKSIKVKR